MTLFEMVLASLTPFCGTVCVITRYILKDKQAIIILKRVALQKKKQGKL